VLVISAVSKIGCFVQKGQAITGVGTRRLLWSQMDVPAPTRGNQDWIQKVLARTSPGLSQAVTATRVAVCSSRPFSVAGSSASTEFSVVKAEFANPTASSGVAYA